jgi:hypothetical protein
LVKRLSVGLNDPAPASPDRDLFRPAVLDCGLACSADSAD